MIASYGIFGVFLVFSFFLSYGVTIAGGRESRGVTAERRHARAWAQLAKPQNLHNPKSSRGNGATAFTT